MKKFISFLLMITMCMTMMAFPALADFRGADFDFDAYEEQDSQNVVYRPQWTYTVGTTQDLGIEKKEATAACSVTGDKSKVTKIVVYMYIQQKSGSTWKTLDSHRYEFNSWRCTKEIKYSPCPHGYTYRLLTTYYVYSGTACEAINGYSANFVYI